MKKVLLTLVFLFMAPLASLANTSSAEKACKNLFPHVFSQISERNLEYSNILYLSTEGSTSQVCRYHLEYSCGHMGSAEIQLTATPDGELKQSHFGYCAD